MTTKFRGKDKETGEWVYGDLIKNEYNSYIRPGRIDLVFPLYRGIDLVEVHPESVGQWTGLKDKNGVDIYGGDLVDPDGVIGQYEIKWSDHYGRVMAVCFSYKEICGGKLEVSSMKEGEVIGNTTDTPELSKGEAQ